MSEMVTALGLIVAMVGLAFWKPPKGKPAPVWFSVLQIGVRILMLSAIGYFIYYKISEVEPDPSVSENNVVETITPVEQLPIVELTENIIKGCWHYDASTHRGYIYFNKNHEFIYEETHGIISGKFRVSSDKIDLFFDKATYSNGMIINPLSMSNIELIPLNISKDQKTLKFKNDSGMIWFSNETKPKVNIREDKSDENLGNENLIEETSEPEDPLLEELKQRTVESTNHSKQ